MFGKHKFYGSTTVGERGQIVLPAKIREEFSIDVGDKLLVLGVGLPDKEGILIIKSEMLSDIIESMNHHFQRIQEIQDMVDNENSN
jgi:AbrB family looped-hinge helix DNA binding protein